MSIEQQAEEHFKKAEHLAWIEEKEDEALEEYRQALELCPDMPWAHLRIGQVHLSAKPPRFDDALSEFKQAIDLAPEWGEAYLAIANALFDMGQFEKAVEEYRRALRLAPDDPRIHISLACCLSEIKHYAEAIEEYRRGIDLKPAYGEMDAHMMLADAYKANGQINEAIREWKIVAGMKPVWDYEKPHPKEAKRMLKKYV